MDDIIQPSRAAKHHARYENEPDYDSECTDIDLIDSHERSVNKRSKLSDHPSTGGARRSARHTNRNAIYNMNVPPQDEDITQMDIEGSQMHASSGTDPSPALAPAGGRVVPPEQRVVPDSDGKWKDGPTPESYLHTQAMIQPQSVAHLPRVPRRPPLLPLDRCRVRELGSMATFFKST